MDERGDSQLTYGRESHQQPTAVSAIIVGVICGFGWVVLGASTAVLFYQIPGERYYRGPGGNLLFWLGFWVAVMTPVLLLASFFTRDR